MSLLTESLAGTCCATSAVRLSLPWAGAATLLLATALADRSWAAEEAAASAGSRETPPVQRAVLDEFGLKDLPEGPVAASRGARLLTRDASGRAVVARLHVSVGQHAVVMLPDGSLAVRAADGVVATDQPFAPLGGKELADQVTGALPGSWSALVSRRYVILYRPEAGGEAFATATRTLLETMFDGMLQYAHNVAVGEGERLRWKEPAIPLVVVIFPTREECEAYRPMPRGSVAYYDVLSNRIVICERFAADRPLRGVDYFEAIATVAHEGVHQILHNIGLQQRLSRWPMWLNEGLAEYFSPLRISRQGEWRGAGGVNAVRLYELDQWLRERKGSGVAGELVARTVGGVRLTSTGYASAWALTHYLATRHPQQLYALVREYSRLEPLNDLGPEGPTGCIAKNLERFKAVFGDDLVAMESEMLQHVARLPFVDPFSDWPHFVGTYSLKAEPPVRDVRVTPSRERAVEWCRAVKAGTHESLRPLAQTSIVEFADRAEAERRAKEWLLSGGSLKNGR